MENYNNGAAPSGSARQSAGEFARNVTINTVAGGAANGGFVRGLFNGTMLILAYYLLVFFRKDFGRKALSLWFMGVAWIVLGLLGTIDLFLHQGSNFGDSYVSYFFGLHSRIWGILVLIHYYRMWRDVYQRNEMRYAHSNGVSILFRWWVNLGQSDTVMKIRKYILFKDIPGGSIWTNDTLFQQFVEPAIAILLGLWMRSTAPSYYGTFLIVSGIALAYRVHTDSELLRDYQGDIIDAHLMGQTVMPTNLQNASVSSAASVEMPSGAVEIVLPPSLPATESPITQS